MRPQQILGVVLLDEPHVAETVGTADPWSWCPPPAVGDGFPGHPGAWPFPVLFAVAHGVTPARAARSSHNGQRGARHHGQHGGLEGPARPDDDRVLAAVADAVARLAPHCSAVVGASGHLRTGGPAADTPTLLSALDLLDGVLAATSRDVAVLTPDGPATAGLLTAHPDDARLRVVGLESCSDWAALGRPDWATAPCWTEDGLRDGLAAIVASGVLDGAGAVVLESPVLSQFRRVVRSATPAPIVDLMALTRQLLA